VANKDSVALALMRGFGMKSIGTAESGFFSRWGWNGGETWSGVTVTPDAAMAHDTVWACVKLIASTVATLPFGFYEREGSGGRKSATDHPLYELLHYQPNARMTAVGFWMAITASQLLWGNAYVEKRYSGSRIVALGFLLPQFVTRPRRGINASPNYKYFDPFTQEEREIEPSRIWQIPGLTLDGENGLSAIQYGRNSIGSALNADKASAETFRDATRASGIVTMDANLTDKQRDSIRAHVKTVSESGGVYVLEKGAGFESLRFNPVDAELLNSRSFSVETICRWFSVPPVMIGHGDKQSSWPTSTEAQGALFIRYVLRACVLGIEQGVRRSLLMPVERARYFGEFSLEGLLRGDSATRSAFYSTALQNGWMTRNEVRRLENLPPVEGGDVLTVQSNLVPLDQLGKAPASTNVQDALKAWLGIEQKTEKPE
jgi:HK97 family phage portal protein